LFAFVCKQMKANKKMRRKLNDDEKIFINKLEFLER
jgi:hypothetical protein